MREWIVTNGLGGYASLTHSNTNTRKFHGLLVASLNPPTERWVFVSNVEDKVKIDDKIFDLKDINGRFTYDLFPIFHYNIEGINIRKSIFMPHEKNTTVIKYEIETNRSISFIHTPIINSRYFYDVTSKNSFSIKQNIFENGVCINPNNIEKSLKIFLNNSKYEKSEFWNEISFEKDQERNDSHIDNNLCVGNFNKKFEESREYYLIFTLENEINKNISLLYSKEIRRKRDLFKQTKLPNKFEKLILSSDNFIVKKGTSKSIIAGYHWFGDWGRDTLISLPGLTLITRRFDIAKEILYSLKNFCCNGLIPNAFMDRNSEPIYNTVDASLWYIDRVFQYLKYTNNHVFINDIWHTLKSIIDAYRDGTDYGIFMDDDFLISHKPGLTWMDVKLGEYYPTPRTRKSVEIQALWYNALRIMSMFARTLGKVDEYNTLSERVKESFNSQYDQQYDVIDTRDLSFRPNQIFLVSLDFSMIKNELQEKIVKEVHEKLLTIFGLRTLSPDDSRYKGTYIGDYNRDIAYHNGTVWPWLMGSFIKSFIKINKYEYIWRKYAYENFLEPMFHVFGKNWDGSIYEIFDGDPPHIPRGCISQAWSVAEILRTWVEDIENIYPMNNNIFTSHEVRI
jgi:predicted glycogen debranching enzyme